MCARKILAKQRSFHNDAFSLISKVSTWKSSWCAETPCFRGNARHKLQTRQCDKTIQGWRVWFDLMDVPRKHFPHFGPLFHSTENFLSAVQSKKVFEASRKSRRLFDNKISNSERISLRNRWRRRKTKGKVFFSAEFQFPPRPRGSWKRCWLRRWGFIFELYGFPTLPSTGVCQSFLLRGIYNIIGGNFTFWANICRVREIRSFHGWKRKNLDSNNFFLLNVDTFFMFTSPICHFIDILAPSAPGS